MVLISRICQRRHCVISRSGEKLGSESPEVSNEKSNYLNGEITQTGLPQCCSGKESAGNAGHMGLIPGWQRSPGEGNGNLLQDSCLRNPWTEDPGMLQSLGLQESDITWQLNN